MKIVVLAGGLCPERDVSLLSGTKVCNALRENGHQAVMVDIYMGLPGLSAAELEDLFVMDGSLLPDPVIGSSMPDLKALKEKRDALFASLENVRSEGNNGVSHPGELTGGSVTGICSSVSQLGPNVLPLCQMADICFLGLHGGIGENGMMQAALDVLGVKYTGASSLASALAMHKGVTKQMLNAAGVPNARGLMIHREDRHTPLARLGFSLPCVVKVCSGGSSIGVYIPQDESEYEAALDACFEMEDDVLIEEYIKGREFAVPVIAGKAYPIIEIIPKNGWFDYENKYQDGRTDEICPAQISPEQTQRMQELAEEACRALDIEVYARPDFLMDDDGNMYLVEINTLPGLTPASLLPKSAAQTGLSYNEFCELVVEESLRKYR